MVSVVIQDVAERTRRGQPLSAGQVLADAAHDTVQIWRGLLHGDLGTYSSSRFSYFGSPDTPLSQQLRWYMLNSLVLLLLAMMLGGLVGGLIGVAAAASRRPGASLGLLLFSIIGISTPSFFLGMLLQYARDLPLPSTPGCAWCRWAALAGTSTSCLPCWCSRRGPWPRWRG